ncbi:MAG: ATP-dependent Clp protease adaptor ClpS, partial [Bacteroidetes bacterium]|nr:ATP-dependent Clp protease adaptor ClpS [Bacteroidota bacterium]
MSGDLDLDVADPELIDEQEEELKKDEPKMFKVVFLNDDFTPMEFVIEMLQKHHNLDFDKATTVMLNVHEKGKGIAGVYTYQIAETK